MNFLFLLFLCFTFKIIDCSSLNQQHEDLATISIDTKASIAETDEDYICATMDFYMFIPEPASLLDVVSTLFLHYFLGIFFLSFLL